VHYPFLVRAALFCRTHPGGLHPAAAGAEAGGCLGAEAVKTCLRGQTFFSLGLRFMYLFIPLVMWAFGGTWLLLGTAGIVAALYVLDQL
jgi:uncharacterized membrane protein